MQMPVWYWKGMRCNMTTTNTIIVAVITHRRRSFGPSSFLTLTRNTSVPLFTVELNQGSFRFRLTATLGKHDVSLYTIISRWSLTPPVSPCSGHPHHLPLYR
jgi:hypothetical protein